MPLPSDGTAAAKPKPGQPASAALRIATLQAMQKAPGFEFRQVHGKLSAAFGPADDTAQVALDRDGFAIALRGGSRFEMRTTRAGRVGTLKPLSSVSQASAKGQTIVLDRPELEERELTGPLGLEQSFRIAARPAGSGPLAIEVEFQGLTPAAPTRATDRVALVDSNGKRRAVYRDLLAVDATGRELPAWMEPTAHSVVLVVDDARASYPIAVDPLVATEQAKLIANDAAIHDGFGSSVSISGNTALVGAFSKNSQEGAAYVFAFDGTSWSEQQKLTASDAANFDRFGESVSVWGNTALVGADGKNSNQGAAYVFTFDGTTWSQQQELTATGGARGDLFGTSVSLANNTALVGASNKASAYVFTFDGTTWSQQQQPLSPGDGSVSAVSLSEGRTTALVGTKVGNGGKGSAYVYAFDGTSWSQQAKFIASDGAVFDFFGASVSLSGNTAVVGAYQHGNSAGAAYVYSFDGTSWSQQAELAHTGGATNQRFGYSVSVAGNSALIGAPGDNAAFAYSFDGTSWSEQAELTGNGVQSTDSFGNSVSLSGGTALTALVGAYSTSSTNEAAYVFTLASPSGAACSTDAECSSGFCVDSVCCDTACGGGATDDCQACSVAAGAAVDGTCGAVADDSSCDDGNACTSGDTCQSGSCTSGTAKSCDDGELCTADLCDASTGTCSNLAVDDGTPCGSGMVCNSGACASGCEIDGTFYADGAFEPGNTCNLCDPSSDTTAWTPNTGASCDDGDSCTLGDSCDASGTCSGLAARSCDDGNACTDDSCDAVAGCVFTANTAPCDDNNACTDSDTCSFGTCVGQAVTCAEDANPCTTAFCSPLTGCGFVDNTGACDDGNACTLNDRCSSGSCTSGAAKSCDDGNVCTADLCDASTGACSNVAVADGTPCGGTLVCASGSCAAGCVIGGSFVASGDTNPANVCEICNPASSTSAWSPNDGASCDDGSACTLVDSCQAGACVGSGAPDCDDGNLCTDDSCDPATGCAHADNTASCDDGDACTVGDVCSGGACTAGPTPLACDDANTCTDDSCDPASGCVFTANDANGCDDGDFCTSGDACSSGVCVGTAVTYDAGDPCFGAACNPADGGVLLTARSGNSCDDGRACTGPDICRNGVCTPDTNTCACNGDVDCAAPTQCQESVSCDLDGGTCVYVDKADGTNCDDGDLCSQTDTCQGGVCIGGNPVGCTASDACHLAGTCDPSTGLCSDPVAFDDAGCDDARSCTAGDHCSAGTCIAGDASACACSQDSDCPAAPACQSVSCDVPSGTCVYANLADSTACDDGSLCTTGERCVSGACGSPTSTVTCTALDQCHVAGTCDPATGLCSDPIATAGTACDDGRTCTTSDACQAGICVGDSSSCGCNGNADCTPLDECHQVGTCDVDLGTCSNPQKADGTGCTGGTCEAGVCVPNGSSSGSSGSGSTSSSSSGSSGTSSSSGSSGTNSSSGSSGTSSSSGSSGTSASSTSSGSSTGSTSSGSSTGTIGASGTSGTPQGPEAFHLGGSGCGCGTAGLDPFALFVLAGAGLAFARRRRGAR